MFDTIFQVKVLTSWKCKVNYEDGKLYASDVLSSFRSNLEDGTSEDFLSLAIF